MAFQRAAHTHGLLPEGRKHVPHVLLMLHKITLTTLPKGPTSILQSPHMHRGQQELMVLITSQEQVLKQYSFMACTSEKN